MQKGLNGGGGQYSCSPLHFHLQRSFPSGLSDSIFLVIPEFWSSISWYGKNSHWNQWKMLKISFLSRAGKNNAKLLKKIWVKSNSLNPWWKKSYYLQHYYIQDKACELCWVIEKGKLMAALEITCNYQWHQVSIITLTVSRSGESDWFGIYTKLQNKTWPPQSVLRYLWSI